MILFDRLIGTDHHLRCYSSRELRARSDGGLWTLHGILGRTLVGRADDRGCHAGGTYDVHRRVWPGEPVVKRFVDRPPHVQFILFIGLSLLLTGVQLIAFGPDPRPSVSQLSFETVSVGGIRLDLARLQAATATTVLIVALAAFLKYSLFGRYIRAAADNRLGGLIMGIPIPKVYAITFGIGTACAGFAGALISPLFDAQPYLAVDFTLLAFIIVIVGGLGSFIGALIGGLTIGVTGGRGGLVVRAVHEDGVILCLVHSGSRCMSERDSSVPGKTEVVRDRTAILPIAGSRCLSCSRRSAPCSTLT